MTPSKPASKMDSVLGTDLVGDDLPAEIAEETTNAAPIWSSRPVIDPTQLQIPFIALQQGLSRAVTADPPLAVMGDWFMDGYAAQKSITVVPLQNGISRRFALPNPQNTDEQITHCYAPTGHTVGIAQTPDGPGMLCEECPLSKWTPSGKTNTTTNRPINTPPVCKDSLDFMVWIMELQTPARLSFRSTAQKAGRQIEMLAVTRGLGQFGIKLKSARETKNGRTYAIPVVELLAADEMEAAMESSQRFASLMSGSNEPPF